MIRIIIIGPYDNNNKNIIMMIAHKQILVMKLLRDEHTPVSKSSASIVIFF